MQQVTRRAWRQLSTDLAASELCVDLTSLDNLTADELVLQYNLMQTTLLDQNCPTVTVRRRTTK